MKVKDFSAAPVGSRPQAAQGPVPTAPKGDPEKVSVRSTREVDAAVAAAKRAAGGERSARLERLEAEVRAGGYRPNPSRVAEQILSDAEVDARLQAMLRR
jgi:hypothetical protein